MSYLVRAIVAPHELSAERHVADFRRREYVSLDGARGRIRDDLRELKRRAEKLGDTAAVFAIDRLLGDTKAMQPGARVSGCVDPFSGWWYIGEIVARTPAAAGLTTPSETQEKGDAGTPIVAGEAPAVCNESHAAPVGGTHPHGRGTRVLELVR